MAKIFLSHYTMILSNDNRHMSRDKCFRRKRCRIVLRHLFLRIKVKVNVFLVLRVSLTAYNIAYYYMVDEQMKVLRSLNNTSYLVTGLFDSVISSGRSSLIIRFLLFFLTIRSVTRH